ncbi:unnamed protein product [Adineta steineri]|uniref:Peptidase S1 domain-containing protein n=1 Tax=Adineta steineri TaxID=433720 RepID=A0A813YKP8_9BILA|nr:unnamed protein product [Adineta steineri]CAF1022820.1 unnamed protein product [Adineta steineri]CAF1158619.1 unnamed protein product [Adineta steineri]
MKYPQPPYGVMVQPATSSTKKIIIIVAVVVTILVVGIIVVGVALGVGLGVGLKHHSDSSSSSSSSSGSSTSILSAPVVTCTYGGSATCGCSATQPSFLSAKIINGYTAVANSWPWMVALYINDNTVFCGGFLIDYQHVLTAAHCVLGVKGSIVAYAGIQTLSTKSSGQSRTVSTFTTHPDYSSTLFTNDLAVLTLASPFTQTTTVGQCCLTSDTSLPSFNQHGVIAGWGEPSLTATTVSDNLMQGVIEVLAASDCEASSSNDNIRFCAGYNGTDACFGDSGSPYMISNNNLWTCAGIVSAGRGCGIATLYTRVSYYYSWIYSIVNG